MSTPTSQRRPDASMSLINDLINQPIDPSYASAAARREAAGKPRSTGLRGVGLTLVAVAIGFLLAAASLTLRVPESAAAQARAALAEQIDVRRERADAQAARVEELRAEIDTMQRRALELSSDSALSADLARLELLAGAVPVTGPGVRLTIDDSTDAGADGHEASSDGRVTSADLQRIVNGLWAGGAEAIAVNGHRLTSRSAIRFAGDAILVDYRPLTRPYVIEAIGNPAGLHAGFAGSDGGSYLQSLRANFGITGDVVEMATLTLPGQPSTSLRQARPLVPQVEEQPPTTPSPGGTP